MKRSRLFDQFSGKFLEESFGKALRRAKSERYREDLRLVEQATRAALRSGAFHFAAPRVIPQDQRDRGGEDTAMSEMKVAGTPRES